MDRFKGWLAILANCYATDRTDAAASFREMAPLLRPQLRETDLTPECAAFVAMHCKRVPTLGQLVDAVKEWRKLYGPSEPPRPALPAPHANDPKPMTDAERAAWQAEWGPKLAALKQGVREVEERMRPAKGPARSGHLRGHDLAYARSQNPLYQRAIAEAQADMQQKVAAE